MGGKPRETREYRLVVEYSVGSGHHNAGDLDEQIKKAVGRPSDGSGCMMAGSPRYRDMSWVFAWRRGLEVASSAARRVKALELKGITITVHGAPGHRYLFSAPALLKRCDRCKQLMPIGRAERP